MRDDFLDTLQTARQAFSLPPQLRVNAERFAREVLGFLFPHFETEQSANLDWKERQELLLVCLRECISSLESCADCQELAAQFADQLPHIREALLLDAAAILENDPAAESLDEVILAYPGFYAIAVHRIAHCFYRCSVPFFPRLLSEFAHRETGIDIHPGATIGRGFGIDHGTGVVIGETAIIGNRVRIFQGVTLGALTVHKDLADVKRHPTIEDDVVIYANATILGGKTVVGRKSIIGGNVWLTQSVPPESVVTETTTVKRPGAKAEVFLDFQI